MTTLYDETGNQVHSVDGRYLVTSSANTIYYSDHRRVRMAPVITKSSGGALRCFIIEAQGYLLASSFQDVQYVGPFNQFYSKLIA